MTGAGDYDDMATLVRQYTGANAVIVAVIGGTRGNGFSVQGAPEIDAMLPAILRNMADQLERDQHDPALLHEMTLSVLRKEGA